MGEAIAELFAQEGAGVAIADTPMLLLVDMQSRAIAETEPIKKVS
jgi:NAD(P)-dependent dehydrogenase (short-subunit alcohol dehydrogenase family)